MCHMPCVLLVVQDFKVLKVIWMGSRADPNGIDLNYVIRSAKYVHNKSTVLSWASLKLSCYETWRQLDLCTANKSSRLKIYVLPLFVILLSCSAFAKYTFLWNIMNVSQTGTLMPKTSVNVSPMHPYIPIRTHEEYLSGHLLSPG